MLEESRQFNTDASFNPFLVVLNVIMAKNLSAEINKTTKISVFSYSLVISA